jgi:hypothetical protein
MAGPPKVNKSEDFELDVPDITRGDLVKCYKQEIREAILALRQLVLVNGTLSRDLMLLHGQIEKHTEVSAAFEWGAHKRLSATPRCRSTKKHDCIMFTAVVLVYYLHQFEAGQVEEKEITSQLAGLRALGANGLKNFKVKGDDRNGYYLGLQKGYGLT